MKKRILSETMIRDFRMYLCREEKSENTKEKYLRDVIAFSNYTKGCEITKDTLISYKQHLIDRNYAIRSINSMLAGINSLLTFLGWNELRVRSLKIQQQIFCPEEKELSREEYRQLCLAAVQGHHDRLNMILQTICGTGIRVSELPFITAEAVRKGTVNVSLKGKTRTVIITADLQKKLLRYIAKQKITTGTVFVTRTGKPINRTSIWREMKKICAAAGVNPEKVFPHNLRHLFARVFYSVSKDIARLADILGHSSINTTRIYIVSTGSEHRRQLEKMRLTL